MSNIYIAGRTSAVEMPLQTIWHRINGQEYERRWWGEAGRVRKLEIGARAGAISVEFTQSPGSALATLTARYSGVISGQELPIETVEIDFTDQPFPLHQNPTFIGISDADVLSMEDNIQKHEANTQTEGTTKHAYYELRSRGVDNYRVKLPVVTWTRTVGVGYHTTYDLSQVGSIFSTANLAGSIGAPILFYIPTGNVGIVGDGGNYTAGWMKDARVSMTGDGKAQIVLIAEYGLWETGSLYEFAG